jgi:iron(III) transport system substrate-binding protein
MLAQVDSAALAAVLDGDSASDRSWVGVSRRISALIYDPARISLGDLPEPVLEMAAPQYKGRLEIAPEETDFEPVVASVAKAQGDASAIAWRRGLKDNAGEKGVAPD